MCFTRRQHNGGGLVCIESKAQICVGTLRCRDTYLVWCLRKCDNLTEVCLSDPRRGLFNVGEGIGMYSTWRVTETEGNLPVMRTGAYLTR